MATITSTGSGNWSAGGTWVGGVAPGTNDVAIIASGHTVTVDTTGIECGNDTVGVFGGTNQTYTSGGGIIVNGTLRASRTANSKLICRGDLIITSTGTLDYGTSADAIPSSYTATIELNKSASPVSAKYGLWCVNGAQFYAYGTPRKTWTTLTADANAGATTCQVDDVTGWASGDRIILPSSITYNQYDERTINGAITGSAGAYIVTLSSALTYTRVSGMVVAMMTHNVIFKSNAAATPGFISHAVTTAQPDASRVARYVLFENLGDGSSSTHKWSGWAVVNASVATYTYDPYRMDDCSFYCRGNTRSIGISWHIQRKRTTVNRCVVYGNQSRPTIFEASGSVLDINDSITLGGDISVQSGHSQGGFSCRHYRCKFYHSSTAFGFTAMLPEFEDCEFDLLNARVMSSAAMMGAKFTRTKFGVTYGVINGSSMCVSGSEGAIGTVTFTDCEFMAGKPFFGTSPGYRIQDMASSSRFVIANKNVDPLVQEIYTPAGMLTRDTSFARDVSGSSLKMTPYSASVNISFDLQCFAPNTKPITVSGYIYLDASYNGTAPTVTLSGLGQSNTWTGTTTTGTWQQFVVYATQSTGADGMFVISLSCNGTAGAAWVDGVSAPTPVAVNTGEFSYWYDGLPAQIMSANFVSATDVWNTQTSELSLAGSIGKKLVDSTDATIAAAILAAAQATPIHANIKKVNDVTIAGNGVSPAWGPA